MAWVWVGYLVAGEVGMRLLDEQVSWVWVVQLRLLPGLQEQVAGEEVDEIAG